jgi:nicotinate phosphoribosyltransferase
MTRLAHDPILTDLYQLTMLQAYWQHGMHDVAVFEFFVRKLPTRRNFLLAAGLEPVLDYIENFHFDADAIAWLRSTRRFADGFLEWLADLRFGGDVHAMPEGTIFFANEPILRIAAPLPQAQIVESRIINLLHYQTLAATKAARMVLASPGATLIDFGFRRAHGGEAGLLAARAAYLAGFAGTATLAAERDFGVPAYGTMAHSFIQAHGSETEAFRHFAEAWPEACVFLVDTYDDERATQKIVALAPELRRQGIEIKGVRLDSGDMIEIAKRVRGILDDAGLRNVRIVASGSVDEYYLKRVVESRAPIDTFGIGTHLATSEDAPYLDCAFKLQEYAGRPRRKRSAGKETWPGRKQVYRRRNAAGAWLSDVLTVESDPQDGEALIVAVMKDGRRLAGAEPLVESRRRAFRSLAELPQQLGGLEPVLPYEVMIAPPLIDLAKQADEAIAAASQA